MRLVLRQNADPQIAGVDEVGQHEVDQPIGAAEGTAGLARSAVSGYSRLPSPPARTMPSTCGASLMVSNLSAAAKRCQGKGLLPAFCGAVRQGIWLRGRTEGAARLAALPVAELPCGYAGGDDDSGIPPEVYGGAGVHVTELVSQLRRLCAVDVHCMGAPGRAPRACRCISPTRGCRAPTRR